jgi:hypothetical protein
MMKNYSEETKAVVNQSIEMCDVQGLVEYACDYISVYIDRVMEYVLDKIEDSEEFFQEELNYLHDRVDEMIKNYI